MNLLLKLISMPVLFIMVILASGCMPRVVVPLKTLEYDLVPGESKLVIFLPGRGERIARIENRGLFEEIRRRGYDVIVPDLHLGYYADGSFLTRLREDILVPSLQRGYKSIWIVGNSLGGNGALFYISTHPGEVDGVILLGPYLGEKDLFDEIDAAGGVKQWEPGEIAEDDYIRTLWGWIKQMPENVPQLFLCYGKGDRFAREQAILGSMLQPDKVVAIEGGHDWKSWKLAWDILFSRYPEDQGMLLP